MTGLRQVAFLLSAFCFLFVGVVRADLRDEAPARPGLKIFGTIVDATQNVLEEDFARLAQAASTSEEAFDHILKEIFSHREPPITTVTARSAGVAKEVVSTSEGTFVFSNLPQGIYEVSAETRALGGDTRRSSARKRIRVVEQNGIVRLTLHEELISVSGRVRSDDGRPLAGAKVIGTPVPVLETGLVDAVSTVSGPDGFFELKGFEPLDLYRIAGYLNGGRLDAPGAFYTQLEVRVRAEGFKQAEENVPRVPLITETQLIPARRLWKALSILARTRDKGDGWREMKRPKRPSSRGSAIMNVDIALDRLASDVAVDRKQ